MAATGFTPIQLYRTATASAAPSAGNLADGELAINTADGKLFYKDNLGAIQVIGWKTVPASAGGTGLTSAGANGNVLTSNGTTWTSAALPPGGLTYIFTTTPVTLTDKQGALTDTSGGPFTVTLPATPATGAQVVVADAGSNWGTNNLTVGRNGSTIQGLAQDLVCDITGASVQLVYDGTTWEVYAQIGGQGGNVALQPGNNAFTGANTFYNATGQTFGTATAAQDGIILTGRAGGTSTFRVTFTPGTLSSNRTLTLPDASGTILQSGTTVTVPQGGTGATTLTGVVKGNGTSAFTAGTVSLTSEVAGTLPVANGGTGASTLTSNNVILGNGTSAVQFVAPGTAGNVLTSNGTTWTSATAGGGGAQPFVTMVGPGDNGVISFQPASNNFGII